MALPRTAPEAVAPPTTAPARIVRTAATAPLTVAQSADSTSGSLLLIAAGTLLLVAIVSGSLLRLLIRLTTPRRGW